MQIIKVKDKAQITIPLKIRNALGIKIGDYLELKVKDNNIIIIPKLLIDKTESVTLSKKGEEMLKEALDDVKKGKIKKFKNNSKKVDNR